MAGASLPSLIRRIPPARESIERSLNQVAWA